MYGNFYEQASEALVVYKSSPTDAHYLAARNLITVLDQHRRAALTSNLQDEKLGFQSTLEADLNRSRDFNTLPLNRYNSFYQGASEALESYIANPTEAHYDKAHELITDIDKQRQVALKEGLKGEELGYQSTLEARLNEMKERQDVTGELLESMSHMQAVAQGLDLGQISLANEYLTALQVGGVPGEVQFDNAIEAYTDCLALYYDNQPEARAEVIRAIDRDPTLLSFAREALSFGIDFVPGLGSAQSLTEIVMGSNVITGHEVSRLASTAGFLGGFVPLPGASKGIKAAVKRSGGVRRAIQHKFQRYLNVRALRRFNLDRLGIPKNYVTSVARNDPKGIRFHHPHHRDEAIRIMPGKPHGLPHQQKPYVVHTRNNGALDKFGNVVDRNSPAAHIPLEEFIFHAR
tara:strand:- start:11183 stop:12397 length:1215 start_codon:yes stop_codon:yes gene_type:complete